MKRVTSVHSFRIFSAKYHIWKPLTPVFYESKHSTVNKFCKIIEICKYANLGVFSECFTELFHSIFGQLFWTFVFSFSSHRGVLHYIISRKNIGGIASQCFLQTDWLNVSLLLFQIWYLANWIFRSLFPNTQRGITHFNPDEFLIKPILTPTHLVMCEWNKLLYHKCNFTQLEIEVLRNDLWSLFILFSPFYWAGFVAQREWAQQNFKVPYKVPHLPHPPFTYERQPQHRDHPTLTRIVCGFFNVPQNYQHSRKCETGPPVYRPYSRRLDSLTICRWNYKGSTFLLSYLKTLSVGPIGVMNSRPPASQPSAQPSEPLVC